MGREKRKDRDKGIITVCSCDENCWSKLVGRITKFINKNGVKNLLEHIK